MDTQSSQLSNLAPSLAQPSAFYPKFFEVPRGWLLPFAIVLISALVMQFVYLNNISIEAFTEFTVRGMDLEDRAEAIQGMSQMSSQLLMIFGLVGVAIGVPIIYSLVALFLLLVNRSTGVEQRSFGLWFSLVCWTSLPATFIAFAGLLNMSLNDINTLAPEAISITNIANLLSLEFGSTAFNLFKQVDLTSLWGIWLMSMALVGNGHKQISAILIAATPVILTMSLGLIG